jgi:hypothetical protein
MASLESETVAFLVPLVESSCELELTIVTATLRMPIARNHWK